MIATMSHRSWPEPSVEAQATYMPSPNWTPTAAFADDLSFTELRVAGTTTPKELAGSIIFNLEQGKTVALSAIGHQAIGQALKAIPVVNGLTIAHGYLLAVVPWFDIKVIPGPAAGSEVERTAMIMSLVKIRPF
jgi:stage V sporulation protein SpoVS